MSIEELNALLELASRAPKTGAEALWLRALIERLKEGQAMGALDAQTPPEEGAKD